MFVEEFKRSKGGMWIMKPVGSAQGKINCRCLSFFLPSKHLLTKNRSHF